MANHDQPRSLEELKTEMDNSRIRLIEESGVDSDLLSALEKSFSFYATKLLRDPHKTIGEYIAFVIDIWDKDPTATHQFSELSVRQQVDFMSYMNHQIHYRMAVSKGN